jgi:hypothetical protein
MQKIMPKRRCFIVMIKKKEESKPFRAALYLIEKN